MIDIIHHGAFSKFIMSRRTKTENDKKRLRRAGGRAWRSGSISNERMLRSEEESLSTMYE
jgi:hypothetical protein